MNNSIVKIILCNHFREELQSVDADKDIDADTG